MRPTFANGRAFGKKKPTPNYNFNKSWKMNQNDMIHFLFKTCLIAKYEDLQL